MSTDAKATIDALLEVLAGERVSIRTLDGAGVERAAAAKEALASRLSSFAPADLTAHSTTLMVLRGELRRNGVLLAHARSCLREVMSIAQDSPKARVNARV